ncbi:rhamnan synthesis F family protein [Aureimonas glaciei]|nr:rhamnan synthesis F family protein [Aureimonas glaciei]
MKLFEQLKDLGRRVIRRYPILRPYTARALGQFQSIRINEVPPLPAPASLSDGEMAAKVLVSPFFDLHYYREVAGLPEASDEEAARHYIISGENQGHNPSKFFDPIFYRERYADLQHFQGNLLVHYTEYGRNEGRSARFDASQNLTIGRQKISSNRETILLVIHESSMTGAPILGLNILRHLSGKYNVLTVSLRSGKLHERLLEYSAVVITATDNSLVTMPPSLLRRLFLTHLCEEYRISGVISNSAETENVIVACSEMGLPVVSLIHEFSEYVVPFSRMKNVLDYSTVVVFSSQLTMDSALQAGKYQELPHAVVLPQGKSVIPATAGKVQASTELPKAIKIAKDNGKFLCIGCGYVQIRKGVDLFAIIAEKVLKKLGRDHVHFIWVGDGFQPDQDPHYSLWLKDQISRSGLAENFSMVPAVDASELEELYLAADMMILSSRLDPFPNVAIDAFHAGLPLLCFEQTTGIAEYLSRDPDLKELAVPYLDVEAAANVVVKLAKDPARRECIAARFQQLASEQFEMHTYVEQLTAFLAQAAKIVDQAKQDEATLREQDELSLESLPDTLGNGLAGTDAVKRYVRLTAAGASFHGGMFRRPKPGFSPHIYRERHPDLSAPPFQNPLAHWIRSGRPEGPWLRNVMSLETSGRLDVSRKATVGLHIHLHYAVVLDEILSRLEVNETKPDLFVSTTSEKAASYIVKRLKSYRRGKVEVRLTPNRGRDIGPMLTEFGSELLGYDIIGHIHGKKSEAWNQMAGGASASDIWREFLFQNLLGDRFRALDLIVQSFNNDKNLGLVFPEDPTVVGWTENYKFAQAVAARIGMSPDLPKAIEFPTGNMFFARPAAIKPLFDGQFDWSDYPEEPIPYDGTILHAIERMTPLVCESQGFSWLTTTSPGYTR